MNPVYPWKGRYFTIGDGSGYYLAEKPEYSNGIYTISEFGDGSEQFKVKIAKKQYVHKTFSAF